MCCALLRNKNMIDFQNDKLEPEVYEALYRTSELMCGNPLPKFETKRNSDGKWICRFAIPGVETVVTPPYETEIEAINMCASNISYILDIVDKKGVYDPDAEESVYRDEIESYFGNVKYDKEYRYMLSHTSIGLGQEDDYLKRIIKKRIKNEFEKWEEEGEIDRVCDWFTITYLLKFRKKNYC